MNNHYHLLIETPQANLSKGMQLLNGEYTQKFNKIHCRVGHVFQGRYKGLLIEKDSYLLEVSRYIVLNPVRAKIVSTADKWNWSSYQVTIDKTSQQSWLASDVILSLFSSNRLTAIEKYKNFVVEGMQGNSPWVNVKKQIYLGSDDFVDEMLTKIDLEKNLIDIPQTQYTSSTQSLVEYEKHFPVRDECIKIAYASGQFSLAEIGNHFGLHYSRVSRIAKKISR